MRRTVILLVAAVSITGASIAAAEMAGTHDVYDLKTFNNTGADGSEISITRAGTFDKTVTYASDAFTTNDAEHPSGGRDMTGCGYGDGTKAVGGRTGWTRFSPGVAGKAELTATTNYDVLLKIWKAPRGAPGATPYSRPADFNCNDSNRGPVNEKLVNIEIAKDDLLLVQTLGVCSRPAFGASWAQACPNGDASAPGGANQVRLVFNPYDTDGDTVPDSIDACEQPGSPPNGCPPAPTPTPGPGSGPVSPPAKALLPVRFGLMPRASTTRVIGVAFGDEYPAPPSLQGTRVTLRCSGRACPAKGKRQVRRAKGKLIRFAALRLKRRGRATITLVGSLGNYRGRWTSWALRRGSSEKAILKSRRDGCVSDAGKLVKACG